MTINVAMYSGTGTNPRKLTEFLRGCGCHVFPVEKTDILRLSHDECEVLYLPGGWYRFTDEVNGAIRRFVRRGGGCVGSCAGAYLVGGYIPLIAGRVLRANIRGRLYLEPQQGNHPILRGVVRRCTRHKDRRWEPVAVTHLGGPMILPDDPRTIVASYDFEGCIGAIVAAPLGRGRAVAIASHPELKLAGLPACDTARRPGRPLCQGDAALIVRNAVLWAAKRHVPA